MNTSSNNPKISAIAVVTLLVMPLCCAVLKPVETALGSDVMLATWANILSCLLSACTAASLYFALGYTLRAVRDGKRFWQFLTMHGIGLLLTYGGALVAYRAYLTADSFSQLLGYTLTTDALNLAIEAVLFAVTIILARLPSIRTSKSLTLLPIVVCAVNSLAWAIASTVIDLVSVGLPINLTEVVYLLSPYALIAATALFGALIVYRILRGRA